MTEYNHEATQDETSRTEAAKAAAAGKVDAAREQVEYAKLAAQEKAGNAKAVAGEKAEQLKAAAGDKVGAAREQVEYAKLSAQEKAENAKTAAGEKAEQLKAKANGVNSGDRTAAAQDQLKATALKAQEVASQAASKAATKAGEAIHANRDKIDQGVDKAATLLDQKTQGKATGIIAKLQEFVGKLLDGTAAKATGKTTGTSFDKAADGLKVSTDGIKVNVDQKTEATTTAHTEPKAGNAVRGDDQKLDDVI